MRTPPILKKNKTKLSVHQRFRRRPGHNTDSCRLINVGSKDMFKNEGTEVYAGKW